jgi:hypothetical protein
MKNSNKNAIPLLEYLLRAYMDFVSWINIPYPLFSITRVNIKAKFKFHGNWLIGTKLLGSNVSACRQTTDPQQITTAEFACRQ